MITKIKIGAGLLLCLALLVALGLYMKERSGNVRLRQEQEKIVDKLRLDQLKENIKQGRIIEQKALKPKNPVARGKNTELSAKALEDQKENCRKCFENFEYDVEVKDQEGRWIFKDSNIFDQTPGQLTLTDRFWKEVGEGNNSSLSPNKEIQPSPKRLKSRILLGFEIDHSKIEYAYSPLGIRTNNFELGLSVYSSLSLNYSFLPTSAGVGVGLEARF